MRSILSRSVAAGLLLALGTTPGLIAQDSTPREREETRYRSASGTSETTRGQARERRRSNGSTRYIFGDWASTGAFGSVYVEVGSLGGKTISFTGGSGALVINEVFLVGGYGQGLNGTASILPPTDANLFGGQRGNCDMSHGGFLLGGVLWPRAAVHPVIHTKLGWGGAEWENVPGSRDAIFIVTPTLGIQGNFNSWLRVDLEVGYRVVDGLELAGFNRTGLNGLMGCVTFKFGDFD